MLHENIRFKRKERGFSQEDLAVRLHVVRQTISKWENGMSVPDAEQLAALADVLHTTVGELLGQRLKMKKVGIGWRKNLPASTRSLQSETTARDVC